MRLSTLKLNLNAKYSIVVFENQPSDLISLDICGDFILPRDVPKLWETIKAIKTVRSTML